MYIHNLLVFAVADENGARCVIKVLDHTNVNEKHVKRFIFIKAMKVQHFSMIQCLDALIVL